jgi:sialate O-acetylesterase
MKRTLRLIGLFLFALVSITGPALAEIKLPAIFGPHCVLQQQTEASLWGKAGPRARVRVTTSWDGRTYSATASAEGAWKLAVKTPKAGGPYELTISDGRPVKVGDVMIGEVWVCSGQSNMEMPVKGYFNQPILGSADAIALAADPGIRLFTVKREADLRPRDDFSGAWKRADPESVSEFSATAYFFGRMLRKSLGVPVGLINASWGGTRIEAWISAGGCASLAGIQAPEQKAGGELSPQTPSVLFNAMIHPMVGYGIRGAIWYQGEANRGQYREYRGLLPGMIRDWRALWGIGEFPFYYAQIAPYDYGPSGPSSAYLREAQLLASSAVPNIGMASLMDLGEKSCIHPADKETGAKRLAYLALARTYGLKGIACQSPTLKEMKVEGSLVKLTFDHAENGLTSYGRELACFEAAGANRRFYPAKAVITGSGITVFCPSVSTPVAVRYAFKDFIVGDLFGTEGLPVSSFRTDDWDDDK